MLPIVPLPSFVTRIAISSHYNELLFATYKSINFHFFADFVHKESGFIVRSSPSKLKLTLSTYNQSTSTKFRSLKTRNLPPKKQNKKKKKQTNNSGNELKLAKILNL